MTPVGQTHGLFGGHVDRGSGCIGKIKELPNFREHFPVFFGFFGQPQSGWSIQFSGRHDLQLFSSLCFFGHWSPPRRQNVDFMFRDRPEFLTGVSVEDCTFIDSSNPQKGVKERRFSRIFNGWYVKIMSFSRVNPYETAPYGNFGDPKNGQITISEAGIRNNEIGVAWKFQGAGSSLGFGASSPGENPMEKTIQRKSMGDASYTQLYGGS